MKTQSLSVPELQNLLQVKSDSAKTDSIKKIRTNSYGDIIDILPNTYRGVKFLIFI